MSSKTIRKEAAAAWDSIRRTAATLDRLRPGTGDELLQRVTRTLEQLETDALSAAASGRKT
jgi:hypothetical protein